MEALKKLINFNDPRVPLGIFYGCRTSLRKVSEDEKANLSHLFDFFSIKSIKVTRKQMSAIVCSVKLQDSKAGQRVLKLVQVKK